MATLTIEAHCVDDDFREELARRGVTIVDESKAPWEWVFEGSRAVLLAMLAEHWNFDPNEYDHLIQGD